MTDLLQVWNIIKDKFLTSKDKNNVRMFLLNNDQCFYWETVFVFFWQQSAGKIWLCTYSFVLLCTVLSPLYITEPNHVQKLVAISPRALFVLASQGRLYIYKEICFSEQLLSVKKFIYMCWIKYENHHTDLFLHVVQWSKEDYNMKLINVFSFHNTNTTLMQNLCFKDLIIPFIFFSFFDSNNSFAQTPRK